MADLSYLYILHFPRTNAIKIGKANEVQQRIETLQRDWGAVDYEGSYRLQLDVDSVMALERSLHGLVRHFSRGYQHGDGKTEMFSVDALAVVLQYLDLFMKSREEPAVLEQGIPAPTPAPTPRRRRKRPPFAKQRENVPSLYATLSEANTKLNWFARWALVLLRRQHRIEYQHDTFGNWIYLRIRFPDGVPTGLTRVTARQSGFRIKHFADDGDHGTCVDPRLLEKGKVIQLPFHSLAQRQNGPFGDPFLYFVTWQLETMIDMLPARSPATKADLPIHLIEPDAF